MKPVTLLKAKYFYNIANKKYLVTFNFFYLIIKLYKFIGFPIQSVARSHLYSKINKIKLSKFTYARKLLIHVLISSIFFKNYFWFDLLLFLKFIS